MIKLTVFTFDMKENDYIHIGFGVEQFTYESENWIDLTQEVLQVWGNNQHTSTASSVTIIFTSDGSQSDQGFRIEMSAVRVSGQDDDSESQKQIGLYE